MIKLEINNAWTKIIDLPALYKPILARGLSYKVVKYLKIRGRMERKQTQVSMLSRGDKVPSGLVGAVCNFLHGQNIDFDLHDNRDIPPEDSLTLMMSKELRPYQQDAVNLVGSDLDDTLSRGIFHHATGAGKTVLQCAIAERLQVPTLVVVPSLGLLNQSYHEFRGWFGERWVGWIGEGKWEPSLLTISTVDTLWSRIKQKECIDFLSSIRALMIDEVHHVGGETKTGNSWYRVVQQCENAYYRYGFTGTVPSEEDEIGPWWHLKGATGGVMHRVPLTSLIEKGFLARPHVMVTKINFPPTTNWKDWRKAYEFGICQNEMRNDFIVQWATDYAAQGLRVLIIVTRIEKHALPLHERLSNSLLITGPTSGEDRLEAQRLFESGKVPIIISTVMGEGIDIPGIDVIIDAAGGDSKIAFRQRLGRGVRKAPGKDRVIFREFFDDDKSFLRKHSRTRLKCCFSEPAINIEWEGFEEKEIRRLEKMKEDIIYVDS